MIFFKCGQKQKLYFSSYFLTNKNTARQSSLLSCDFIGQLICRKTQFPSCCRRPVCWKENKWSQLKHFLFFRQQMKAFLGQRFYVLLVLLPYWLRHLCTLFVHWGERNYLKSQKPELVDLPRKKWLNKKKLKTENCRQILSN